MIMKKIKNRIIKIFILFIITNIIKKIEILLKKIYVIKFFIKIIIKKIIIKKIILKIKILIKTLKKIYIKVKNNEKFQVLNLFNLFFFNYSY